MACLKQVAIVAAQQGAERGRRAIHAFWESWCAFHPR